jgi:hypothetical protein
MTETYTLGGDITIAYDFVLKRPGCALLQAAFGATLPAFDLHRMDNWLLHPTDDLKMYAITREQLDQLVQITNDAFSGA